MFRRETLRSIHLAGTVWFVLCVGYVLVLALRQAGVGWWVLFSLSGHGVLIAFILISLYLFAIFRGISSSQMLKIEHPLTSGNYYAVFYVTTPFLGGVAGCLGMIGIPIIMSQFLLGVALGTLGATFLVWVIVDPVAGVLELLVCPAGRRHRAHRLAEARAGREEEHRRQERLLAEILEAEKLEKCRWAEMLKPEAQKLAELLTADTHNCENAERKATDIGANAWRIGGLSYMRELRKMAIDKAGLEKHEAGSADYISVWWDGIGDWRNPSVHRAAERK